MMYISLVHLPSILSDGQYYNTGLVCDCLPSPDEELRALKQRKARVEERCRSEDARRAKKLEDNRLVCYCEAVENTVCRGLIITRRYADGY